MAISTRNGWGMKAALIQAQKVAAGANVVNTNLGAGASIVAGSGPLRLTKVAWRVDIAPDVAVGVASGPTRWRLVVARGTLPPDVSAFQTQAFAAGSHPEIPQNIDAGAPLEILFDLWLDFSANDPGLNQLAFYDFADAGPTIFGGDTMLVFLVPIVDAQLSQAIVSNSNALVTVGAWGVGVTVNPQGGTGNPQSSSQPSMPRYDARFQQG